MNAAQAVLVFLAVAVPGVGPFIAVYRGGNEYDFPDEPQDDERADDTTQIPRIVVTDDDPYMY